MNHADSMHSPTVAVLTPIGRGAVATIRVEADPSELDRSINSLFRAANSRPLSQQSIGKIVFGRWGGELDQGEDVVVCRVESQTLDIHCHGGDVAVQRIADDLNQAGCQTLTWQQQLTKSHDGLEADCHKALSQATTWRTAEILYEQSAGLLREAFEPLLQLCSAETIQTELLPQLDALLAWSRFGQHLSRPWNVVLSGRPNVGKSSLINALLGYQRAIVFDQPGTTRDVVTAETAFDGWPILLADTAGLREATEELEAAGIALARRRLETADARLVLIDLSEPPTDFDERLLTEWPDAIVIGHKCDLIDQWGDRRPAAAILVSSVTGQGMDELQRTLVEQLVPRVPPPGTPIPINERQTNLLMAARDAIRTSDLEAARRAISRLFEDEFHTATRSSSVPSARRRKAGPASWGGRE